MAVAVHEFLTASEVAQVFRVSAQTVKAWGREGKLPAPVKVGRRCLFRAEEIDKFRHQLRHKD
jgi:excisionase family DNA binding protein